MERTDLLEKLAKRILAQNRPHPLRVGIDGVDAAGKTTLADALSEMLAQSNRPVIRASIDQFHHPREIRYRQGADSPRGYYEDSFDLTALKRLLLDPLGPGGTRTVQVSLFDYHSDTPTASAPFLAANEAILVFDGIFLLRPELAGCWDLSIFLKVSFDTVLKRVVQRDHELLGGEQQVLQRYTQKYIPAQRTYLANCHPTERADVLIDNEDPNHPDLLRI